MRPGKVSPRLVVPTHIKMPDYAYTGIPAEEINSKYSEKFIEVKSAKDLDKMR